MRAALPVILLVLLLPPSGAQEEPPQEGTMLHMLDYDYAPDPLEVEPGSTVIAMNFGPSNTSVPRDQWGEFVHSITAVDGSFDLQAIQPDFEAHPFPAPEVPGEYPYYCRYHGDAAGNGMVGTLIVKEGAAPATPPTMPATSPAPSEERETPGAGGLVALVALALVAVRRR